ncbi:MAG: phosphoribosylformylglycinamidine synthase I [Candidatus Eisenbacteria bacterium]
MPARVAVVQFPGVNCETESVRALQRVGLVAEVFRWTRPARDLSGFDAFLIPGGFSYQDRVRAGALAAKDPLVDTLAAEAERGKPVLGICNGAQVLVEAGLVPDSGEVGLSLARNRMNDRSGYYARWVYTRVESSSCLFTRGLAPGMVLPLPMAHGEGRFTAAQPGRLDALLGAGQVPLRYATVSGEVAGGFPDNPNGAEAAAAAVCNPAGNVLAIMPHPERAQDLGGITRTAGGPWGHRRDEALERGVADAPGPGLLLFEGLRRHLEET